MLTTTNSKTEAGLNDGKDSTRGAVSRRGARCGVLAVATSLLASGLLLSRDAAACGCFAPPIPQEVGNFAVNQRAEQIIFEVKPETASSPATVSAHVRILYEGDPEQFAWLLPMPTVPEIELSHTDLFGFVEQQTVPLTQARTGNVCPQQRYYCQTHPPCPVPNNSLGNDEDLFADSAGPMASQGTPGGNGLAPPVTVLASARVGSYDTITFAADEADLAVAWLNENGFIVNETMSPYMQPYLDAGLVFVASKLVPGADVAEIRPLRLTYVADQPSIPLRLTAIAAEPHMTVTALIYAQQEYDPVLAPVVTVPEEEHSSLLRNNYPMLLARVVDEGGGFAFVKEYAGTPPRFNDTTGCCGIFTARAELPAMTPLDGGASAASDAGVLDPNLDAGQSPAPQPDPAEPQPIDSCGIGGDGVCQCPNAAFDNADCSEELVLGIEEANRLADEYPILTRLTTRISPEEMVEDPLFEPAREPAGTLRLRVSGIDYSLAACEAQILDSEQYESIVAESACSAVYCDWGECVITQAGAGCRCDEGFVARVFPDADNQSSITCVPETPPVDFAAGGLELESPCDALSIDDGACVDLGGFAGVRCDAGLAAVIGAEGSADCVAVESTTATPGATNYSLALKELDVCAPAPPQCTANGWLIERQVSIPGVQCGEPPDPSWFEPPPAPICEPETVGIGLPNAASMNDPVSPATMVDTTEPRPGSTPSESSPRDDGGCAVSTPGKGPAQFWTPLVGLWLLLRRRRPRILQ